MFPTVKHRSTRDAVEDLRKGGYLIQIDEQVDAHLEMAEIQRRVYANAARRRSSGWIGATFCRTRLRMRRC